MRLAALIFITTLAHAQNAPVTISIDASANRHPINPNIYGVAYAGASTLADLNVVLHRYGGNNTTRYNWQVNGDNRGQDWYFESLGDSSATPGERGDTFITSSRTGGAEPMITIPIIGWIAKLGPNRGKLASFSIAKYGPQTGNDWQWFADAGNGVKTSGAFVTGNDPSDANVANSSALQRGWVTQLAGRSLKYYILDNEHSIWHGTHRDVQPVGATMEQIRDRIIDYSAMIKSVDANAKTVGPEEWGWSGYLLSGYDQQYGSLHGWSFLPDRAAHANMDYLPWLLTQLRQTAQATGVKPLDVFSVHYYPQGGEFGNDTSASMQQRRNRSTRSLWDPAYVDETWIADKVQLIPRLKSLASTYYYAGTPVAITEYNWGAEGHINGATAQADILGIFGREGLDMGTRWTTPDASTPTYKAMKMYRNYDNQRSGFGDTSVTAAVPNPDNLSAFAALRSTDGALTVMVISKVLSGTTPVTLNLSGFSGNGAARRWQLTSTNTIAALSDVTYTGSSLAATVPQQSITLFVLPAGTVVPPPVTVNAPTGLAGTGGIHQIALRWTDRSNNETGLTIQRAPSNSTAFANVGQTGANVTAFTDSVNRGTYVYRVRAFNSTTVSTWSNTVTLRAK